MGGSRKRKRETSPPRIHRDIRDLVEALQKHVKLLKGFSIRAFEEGDYDYLGRNNPVMQLVILLTEIRETAYDST